MRRIVLLLCLAIAGSTYGQPDEESIGASDRNQELHRLAEGLPDVLPIDADEAVDAALAVETAQIPAELLIAIAWGESRFVPTTVTGKACGPMQTISTSLAGCLAMQAPIVGFGAGVAELTAWLRLSRGDLRLALAGYACGMSAFSGTCHKMAWPGWVLYRARRLGYRSQVPRS